MHKAIVYILFFILLSCKNDGGQSASVMPEGLVGTWKVVEATRNNRPARSLENAEFYIDSASFSTNFMPDQSPYAYSFDGKKISLTDSNKTVYRVSRKTADTLLFSTVIKNFEFEFVTTIKKEDIGE